MDAWYLLEWLDEVQVGVKVPALEPAAAQPAEREELSTASLPIASFA